MFAALKECKLKCCMYDLLALLKCYVEFEVLMVVTVRGMVFWFVRLCSSESA
jgi:hypothetical protein